MEKENSKTNEPRSGWLFTPRDKAYHSYMYSLQKKHYGIGIGEYAKAHNLNRSTFRGWIECLRTVICIYQKDYLPMEQVVGILTDIY